MPNGARHFFLEKYPVRITSESGIELTTTGLLDQQPITPYYATIDIRYCMEVFN